MFSPENKLKNKNSFPTIKSFIKNKKIFTTNFAKKITQKKFPQKLLYKKFLKNKIIL